MPVKPIPDGYGTATPYLTISDPDGAIAFYKAAFGAAELFRMPGPDGKVMHAEIQIGNSRIMLGAECQEYGAFGPKSLGGSPVGICLYVEDVDAVAGRAVAAGATLTKPVADQFYGDRSGKLEDPYGHVWTVATHTEDVTPEEIQRRLEAFTAKAG